MNWLIALTALLFLILWISVIIKPPEEVSWKDIIDPPKPKKKKKKALEGSVLDNPYESVILGAAGQSGASISRSISSVFRENDDLKNQLRYIQEKYDYLQRSYYSQTQQYQNQLAAQQAQRPFIRDPRYGYNRFYLGQVVTHIPSMERATICGVSGYDYDHYDLSNGMQHVPSEDLV